MWGKILLYLLFSVGLLFTFRSGFFQLTHFKSVLKNVFSKGKDTSSLSNFQILCISLGSCIGTGNIAGVIGALLVGGPGSIFWMWVCALFSMMTSFGEHSLSIYFKNKFPKSVSGPMGYLEYGVGAKKGCKNLGKFLAFAFSLFCILASFGMGNMAQSNTISTSVCANFNIDKNTVSVFISVFSLFIILGSVLQIGKLMEKLVPTMACVYIFITLAIILKNSENSLYALKSIFKCAFSFESALGGTVGYGLKKAVTNGFKRGIFSNEAGLGSQVLLQNASSSKVKYSGAMIGIFTVFFDTVIICTLTALSVLSVSYTPTSLNNVQDNISPIETYINISDDKNNTFIISDKESPKLNFTLDKISSDFGENKIYVKKDNIDTSFSNLYKIKGVYDEKNLKKISVKRAEPMEIFTCAIKSNFGDNCSKLFTLVIVLFAFSTLVGWFLFGCYSWQYLFGKKYIWIYKLLYALCIYIGAMFKTQSVWTLCDIFNSFMAIPNLVGLLLLRKTVYKIIKECKNDT